MKEIKERRTELANFLRNRRARLAPAKAGIPLGRRRRVAGLRREEVADLAGISATWYTWLEQGRAINASSDALERLASVLQLEGREREHLFLLAGHPAPTEPTETESHMMALIQQTLDNMNPSPAYVLNNRWDLMAWNDAASAVFGDFGQVPEEERNIVWLTFQRESPFSKVFVDWDRYARCVVGNFRVDSTLYVGDARWADLTSRLVRESSVFAALWPSHEVAAPIAYRKEMNHPEAGLLTFEPIHLDVQHPSRLKIVSYLSCPDTKTAARLVKLMSRIPTPQLCASGK
jgi:transcriptional regulator with XRE-family HTH domain